MSMDAVERALQTRGGSEDAIYAAAARLVRSRGAGGVLVDVGCGNGRLQSFTSDFAGTYIGVDLVRHSGLPPSVPFVCANLDREPIPLEAAFADVVAAVETVEHLENPRALFRELVRILRPGGWLVVTTPNQVSVLSLLSLALKGRFVAFQDAYYPIHCTALLPIDLLRMAGDCRLTDAHVSFTESGRIPLTRFHYPRLASRTFPRLLSDNVLLLARKPSHG